jgi:hypothetical protein
MALALFWELAIPRILPAQDEGGSEESGEGSSSGSDLDDLKARAKSGKINKNDIDKALEMFNKGEGKEPGSIVGDLNKMPTAGERIVSVADLPSEDVAAELNSADKAYVKAHWSNARRNYKKKNLDRALEEVKNILSVDKNNGEAYLMRASALAMRKDFSGAWQALDKAKKLLPTDAKVAKFAETLSKTSPRQDSTAGSDSGSGRPAPKFAFEAAVNALEDFFADRASTGKVRGFELGAPADETDKVTFAVAFSGIDSLDPSTLGKRLKELSKREVGDVKAGSTPKNVELKLIIPDLPSKNPAPAAIVDLAEWLKIAAEETDIKIDHSEEGLADANKLLTGRYTLIGRSITSINEFLRKMTPFAESFALENLQVTAFGSNAFWKGTAKITFKTE